MIAENKDPQDSQPLQNPLPTENNGRQPNGRFGPGNRIAAGNPHQRRVQAYRAKAYETEPDRVRRVMNKLFRSAMEGDVNAMKEFLNRTVGKYENQADPPPQEEGEINIRTTPDALRSLLDAAGRRIIAEQPPA